MTFRYQDANINLDRMIQCIETPFMSKNVSVNEMRNKQSDKNSKRAQALRDNLAKRKKVSSSAKKESKAKAQDNKNKEE